MLLEGRKGLIVGVANKRSIAWSIAAALHREGARLAFASAEAAYRRAGAAARLRIDVAVGVAHQVTAAQRQLALEWFDRWLKP